MKRTQVWLAMSVLAVVGTVWGDIAFGYRDRGVVNVASGETTSSRTILGDGALLGKDGAGTLNIETGGLRPATDARVTVAEGTVQVTASADVDDTTPPTICTEAGFWVDANVNIVSTNNVPEEGETASTFVTKWCDRRETDTVSSSLLYAVPKWHGNASYPGTLTNVPPTVTTFDGRTGVYFGGRLSGQYLRWRKNGSETKFSSVYHLFIVHAVTNALGNPVGYESSGRTGPLLNTVGATTPAYGEDVYVYLRRGDVCYPQMSARFRLDGVKCDGHSTKAKRAWQLWECDYHDVYPGADNFYRSGFTETLKGAQGGDYLGEVLVFTNRLTEAECAQVERYLLAKWELPQRKNGLAPLRTKTVFALASNATVRVTGAASTVTPPLAFAGNGSLVKDGEGILALGPSDDLAFAGDFTWNAGSIRLQGGRLPPLAVASGDKFAFSGYRGSETPSRTGDDQSGLTCARTSDAGSGIVETTGNGWLRVNAVSNNVKTVKVGIPDATLHLGAVLQLEGRVRGVPAPADGPLAATFVNPDMEMPCTLNDHTFDRCYISNNSTVNGWTGRENTTEFLCIQAPRSANTWSQWLNSVVPQLGSNVLQIVQRATVSTTVTVPKAGVYELSFDARGRYAYSNQNFNKTYAYADQQSQVDILFGRTWANVERVGTLPIGCPNWYRFRYRINVPAAGTWELGLRSLDTGYDSCVFFDNFAMVRIPEPTREEICAIPNGNFDRLTRPCDPSASMVGVLNPYIHGIFTTLNRFTDWELSVNPNAPYGTAMTNGLIGAVTSGTPAWKSSFMHLFPFADYPEGAGVLAFASTGGLARVSFAVPAGTWRLRGKVARFPSYWSPDKKEDKGWTATPKISARITRANDAVVNLGQVSATAQELRTFVWPTALTLAEGETVTLSLEQTVSGGIAVLDDLELVKESTLPDENLLTDPGFENGANWPGYKVASLPCTYQSAGPAAYSDRPQYWGYSVYEGNGRLYLHNSAGVRQDISVPEAGLYRFTMHVRARADGTWYGNNPVRVYATQGGVTNVFATTPTLYTRHWVEVSYLARFPAAGTWRLHLEGQCRPDLLAREAGGGAKADADAHIDGASLVRCRDVIDEVPDIPSTLKFDVAEGAQLLLDYEGTAKCGPVKYAGRTYIGTIDASTHPEFVTGLGALEAQPLGTIMIVR